MQSDMIRRTTVLNVAHDRVKKNVRKAQDRQIKEFAKRRETATSLPPIGSAIWLRRNRAEAGKKRKKSRLGEKDWYGPFRLHGDTDDQKRAIIEAPTAEGGVEQWTESWIDEATKMDKEVKVGQERRVSLGQHSREGDGDGDD